MAFQRNLVILGEHLDEIDFRLVAACDYAVGVAVEQQAENFVANLVVGLLHLTGED